MIKHPLYEDMRDTFQENSRDFKARKKAMNEKSQYIDKMKRLSEEYKINKELADGKENK